MMFYAPRFSCRMPVADTPQHVWEAYSAELDWANRRWSMVSWSKARGYHLVGAHSALTYKPSPQIKLVQINLSNLQKVICDVTATFVLLQHKTGDRRVFGDKCIRAGDLKSGDILVDCTTDHLSRSVPKGVSVVKTRVGSIPEGALLTKFQSDSGVPVGVHGVLAYPGALL